MSENRDILGLDVGGTHYRMGLVDRSLIPRRVEVGSSRALIARGDSLAALAERIQTYLQAEADAPALVCIGLPAVLNRERRRVLSATNFPGLEGRDIVDWLENRLGLPVVLEHDAYYLLAYDIHRLGLVNRGTIMGCYFGTGLGNALFINGEPYIGKNGTACELGHMPVPLNDRPCSCGNVGCIEMFSCGKALEGLAGERFPREPIGTLFSAHPDAPELMDFVRYMAAAVATEVNILDPDHVLLGGGLVQMADFPREAFRKAILDSTRKPCPAENLSLFFAVDAPENGIIGAAIEGYRRLDAGRNQSPDF